VGSFLNVWKLDNVNQMQKIAMEQSRLKIPLIMGKDVIHGFRTVFPIPLAQAASFNPDLAEAGSRVAAIECSSMGVNWTFTPMVDIARDPRWGRIA
jgi:beta-glucosidase